MFEKTQFSQKSAESARNLAVIGVGIIANMQPAIQVIERLHGICIQRKVKHGAVFANALGPLRFRDRDMPALQVPTQENLRRRFLIRLRQRGDDRVLHRACAVKRTPRDQRDVMRAAEFSERALLIKRV